jgi:hypothetical protein
MKIKYRTTDSHIIITGVNPTTGEQIEIKTVKGNLIDLENLTSDQVHLLTECYTWMFMDEPMPEDIMNGLLNEIKINRIQN